MVVKVQMRCWSVLECLHAPVSRHMNTAAHHRLRQALLLLYLVFVPRGSTHLLSAPEDLTLRPAHFLHQDSRRRQ